MEYGRNKSYVHQIDSIKQLLTPIEYPAKNNKRCIRKYIKNQWQIRLVFQSPNIANTAKCRLNNRASFLRSEDKSRQASRHGLYKLKPIHTNRESISCDEPLHISHEHEHKLAVNTLNTIINENSISEWPVDEPSEWFHNPKKCISTMKNICQLKNKLSHLLQDNRHTPNTVFRRVMRRRPL